MSTGRAVIAVAVIVGHVLVLYGVAALAAVGRQRVIEAASEPIVVTMIAASRGPAQPAAQSTPEPAAPHPQEKLQPHAKPQQPPPQAKSLAKPQQPPQATQSEPRLQPQRPPVRSTARSEPPPVRSVSPPTNARVSPPVREEPQLAMRDQQTPTTRSVPQPLPAREPAQPPAPAAPADPPAPPAAPAAVAAAVASSAASPASSTAATASSTATSASSTATSASSAASTTASAALTQAARADHGPGSRGMPISEGIEYLREPQPWYPPLARQRGEHGRVVVLVWVDARGVPARLAVHASSGSPRLDRAALDAAAEALFKPFVEHGQPVPKWALVPIAFRLDP